MQSGNIRCASRPGVARGQGAYVFPILSDPASTPPLEVSFPSSVHYFSVPRSAGIICSSEMYHNLPFCLAVLARSTVVNGFWLRCNL